MVSHKICSPLKTFAQIFEYSKNEISAITKEVDSIPIVYFERISQNLVKWMKLPMEYHNNYLQYI
jgi:hypothetical protein